MTGPRDPERLISEFLEDGLTELPNRAYDAVRSQVDHTRQRVVIGPWKEEQVSRFAMFAIAAAAVVLVAVIGIRFLPGQDGVGGPVPTATPTPIATPSPTPSPPVGAVPLPISGNVAAGTYYRLEGGPGEPPIRVTFTMPAGWMADEGAFLYKSRGQPGEVMLVTWAVTDIYSDACHWVNSSLVDVRGTPDDLVFALSNQEGREEAAGSWPWQGTVAGFPAEGIAMVVAANLDTATCSGGILRYWPDPGPDFSGGLCCNLPGNTDFIYAVDVSGTTIAVVARHYADSSPADLSELDGILSSLRLEP
ncbi:MAG: hypothetical protein ACXWZL_04790 [Mycobacterium sp.]